MTFRLGAYALDGPEIPLKVAERWFGVESVSLHFLYGAVSIHEGLAEIFLED